MKILYHHRTAARDGMSVHIEQLVAALRGDGHEVLVVGPTGELASPDRSLEGLSDRLRSALPRSAYETLEIAYNVRALQRLEHAYRSFAPDILYERYNLFLRAGLWLSRKYGLPMILEVNAPLAQERSQHGGLSLRGLATRFERSIWNGADAVLPVTGVLADMVAEARGSRDGIFVIPNGVDLRHFEVAKTERSRMRKKLGLDDAIVLGFCGYVREWHGLDWAVEALSVLPDDVKLLMVGDGPAQKGLEAKAKDKRVSARVHFIGRIEHDRIPVYLSTFDVALQPRAVSYASPLKLFEYMALGLPVIAPDQPNISEVVRPDETAMLFDPSSYASFLTCLQLLCRDVTLRHRLGRAARQAVETAPYTWQRNALRVAEIGSALLSRSEQGLRQPP